MSFSPDGRDNRYSLAIMPANLSIQRLWWLFAADVLFASAFFFKAKIMQILPLESLERQHSPGLALNSSRGEIAAGALDSRHPSAECFLRLYPRRLPGGVASTGQNVAAL